MGHTNITFINMYAKVTTILNIETVTFNPVCMFIIDNLSVTNLHHTIATLHLPR